MTPCSECGRPVKVMRSVRKKSSRAARAGRPTALKDHDLCMKCWRRQADRSRAATLAHQLDGRQNQPE